MDDPRPMFAMALDQAGELFAAATPDRLDRVTPCPGSDVRSLLGHLVGWLQGLTARAHPPSAAAAVRPAPGGGGWQREWSSARADFEQVWSDRGVLDRLLPPGPGGSVGGGPAGGGGMPGVTPGVTPGGMPGVTPGVPGRMVLVLNVPEVAVHCWDLAVPLGLGGALQEEVGRFALSLARRGIPARPRGPGCPFDPVVVVPEGAGAYAQLAGWLGRVAS